MFLKFSKKQYHCVFTHSCPVYTTVFKLHSLLFANADDMVMLQVTFLFAFADMNIKFLFIN